MTHSNDEQCIIFRFTLLNIVLLKYSYTSILVNIYANFLGHIYSVVKITGNRVSLCPNLLDTSTNNL